MKYGRFKLNGQIFYGRVEGDSVVELEGSPFDSFRVTSKRHTLASLKTLLPCVPGNFYCAGLNYLAHIEWASARKGLPVKAPQKCDVGYRSNNALIATGETIVIPADSPGPVQYEGELVVVIGRKCKNLTRENALSAVLGYSIGNDVSERDWQRGDRTFWRGKNADTFKPMGPWIDTDVDLDAMKTVIRVNGKEDLRFKTNDMIFSIPHFLSEITKYITLYPGDVMWCGTDGTSPNLVHGDVVEVELTGLRVLRNRFVKAAA